MEVEYSTMHVGRLKAQARAPSHTALGAAWHPLLKRANNGEVTSMTPKWIATRAKAAMPVLVRPRPRR